MLVWPNSLLAMIRRLLKNFNREAFFAMSMMAATGFGLAKVIALAVFLPVEGYGFYISAFGMATFLGMLLSLGQIEPTYKVYPKLEAVGRGFEIPHRAQNLMRSLAVRLALCLAIAGLVAFKFEPFGIGLTEVAAVMVLALLFMAQTLMASVIRAIDSERFLPRFTAARGLMALGVTAPVAVLTQNWLLVLQIESLGIVLALLVTAFALHRHSSFASSIDQETLDVKFDDQEQKAGRLIYSSGLIAASIPYGGRSVLLALDGPAMAGAFGVLNALVQVAQLLASALAQKLAPDLLKEAALRGENARVGWIDRFGVSLVLLWGTSIAVLIGTSLSFLWTDGFEFWSSYNITITVLLITALQMAMSAHLFLFFAIVSEDREKDLVFAALSAVLVFYAGLKLSSMFAIGLPGYAASAALASTTHTLYLATCYKRAVATNG